ncbi:MAG: Sec-independent protein translocase protein TatB [Gammaproteobacteria bacterium]|nr:Sec-independent protein translocase protein TatB [Gammaproteobacteria bacterium]
MFDVGFWELLMIGVIGLLVVGPERLPEFARTIGRWVGQAQRMVRSVRADIERELETENLRSMINQQEEQIQELKGMVREVRDETEASVGADTLSEEFDRMQKELTSDAGASARRSDDAPAQSVQTPADGATPAIAETVDTAEAGDKKS